MSINNYYISMMKIALEQAKIAESLKEVPIGAVIVKNGEIIATGYNKRETQKNALLHAEIDAINNACIKLSSWRLDDCDLFVTLEPCPMCSGAIINSRIKTVIYGAPDKKAGCLGSVINMFDFPFNHRPKIVSGILQDECSEILKNFFKTLRK